MYRRAALSPLLDSNASTQNDGSANINDDDTSFLSQNSNSSCIQNNNNNTNNYKYKKTLTPLEPESNANCNKEDEEAVDEDDDIISNFNSDEINDYNEEELSAAMANPNEGPEISDVNKNGLVGANDDDDELNNYIELKNNVEEDDGEDNFDNNNETDQQVCPSDENDDEKTDDIMKDSEQEIEADDEDNGKESLSEPQQFSSELRVTFAPEVHQMALINFAQAQMRRAEEEEDYEFGEDEDFAYNYATNYEEQNDGTYLNGQNIEEHDISYYQNKFENNNDENSSGINEENYSDKEISPIEPLHSDSDDVTQYNNGTSPCCPQEEKKVLVIIENEREELPQNENQNDIIINKADITESQKEAQPEKDVQNEEKAEERIEKEDLKSEEEDIQLKPIIPKLDLAKSLLSKSVNKGNSSLINKFPSSAQHKLPEPVIPIICSAKSPKTTKILQNSNNNVKSAKITSQSIHSIVQNKGNHPIASQHPQPSAYNANIINENLSTENQQQQQQSIESKAEELRNNGFMITFLQSPKVGNNNSNVMIPSSPKQAQTQDQVVCPQLDLPESKPCLEEGLYILDNLVIEEKKVFTDEELLEAIEKMLETHKLPPKDMHQSLYNYLKKNIFQNIIDQDYDEAERLKMAENMLSEEAVVVDVYEEKKQLVKSIEQRIEATKERLKDAKQYYQNAIEKFERDIQEKTNELELKQKEEVDNFEKTWNSQDVLLQFNKPSAQLLDIRRMQRNKALANDFAGARELKKRGDLLEKEETRRAEYRATMSMKKAFDKLNFKQSREMDYAKQNWQRQRILVEAGRDQGLQQIELSLKQLITKLNESKSKPSSCISNVGRKKRKSSRELTTPSMAPTTPRTRRQMAEFKVAPRQEKLALNGIGGVHSFVSKNKHKSSDGSARKTSNF